MVEAGARHHRKLDGFICEQHHPRQADLQQGHQPIRAVHAPRAGRPPIHYTLFSCGVGYDLPYNGHFVACSEDGVRWSDGPETPVIPGFGAGWFMYDEVDETFGDSCRGTGPGRSSSRRTAPRGSSGPSLAPSSLPTLRTTNGQPATRNRAPLRPSGLPCRAHPAHPTGAGATHSSLWFVLLAQQGSLDPHALRSPAGAIRLDEPR